MGRFETTGPVEDRAVEHSVVALAWGMQLGAGGASDGSLGVRSNVPGALAVLRHAPLYAAFPEEIEEAFGVLERHVMLGPHLFPVAVPVLPFLFDFIRRRSLLAERISLVIARYAARAATLEAPFRERFDQIIVDHKDEIVDWLGRHDRAVAALAIHVPQLRADVLTAIEYAHRLAPCVLLALIELGVAPGKSRAIAMRTLDRTDITVNARMAAAAFLARHGQHTPDLCTRIDAALPPSAPGALERYVAELWKPTIDRPVVAPQLHDGQVVFAGEQLVVVRAGAHTVTMRWPNAAVKRGDTIKVGLTAHGQPKLALVTDGDGRVTVVDF
jgi:hypothetical protein